MELNKLDFLKKQGIYFSDCNTKCNGKILFMFPGHGSQYSGVLKELVKKNSAIAGIISEADKKYKELTGKILSEYLFDEEQKEKLSSEATIMQPAILTVNYAFYYALEEAGIKPDYLLGHSFGEFSSLVAGNVIDFKQGIEIAYKRAQALNSITEKMRGRMLSIKAEIGNHESLCDEIAKNEINAYKALVNSDSQIVFAGLESDIKKLEKYCSEREIRCTLINASHAFHSKILEPVVPIFKKELMSYKYNIATKDIYSTITDRMYSTRDEEEYKTKNVAERLSKQLTTPFCFYNIINTLYENYNVRFFIEVGGKNILTNLVNDILKVKEHYAIPVNEKKIDDEVALTRAIANFNMYSGKIVI